MFHTSHETLKGMFHAPLEALNDSDLLPCLSGGDNAWKNAWTNVLTPPRSPQHESQESTDTKTDFTKVSEILDNMPVEAEGLMDFLASACPEDTCPEDTWPEETWAEEKVKNLESNLIKDIMWSAPSHQAAGLGQQSSEYVPTMKTVLSDTPAFKTSSSALDIASDECVSPTAVFPNVVIERKVQSSGMDTPSESEDTDQDVEDESDEEIDVVSVSEHQMEKTSRRKGYAQRRVVSSPYSQTSSSSSTSAQVAVMHHNYSAAKLHRISHSAPHSLPHIPSASSTTTAVSLKRSYHSSPRQSSRQSSPHTSSSSSSSSSASKRRKLAATAMDYRLKKVAQKLSQSQASRGAMNRVCGSSPATLSNSRSGSDSEDCEGKRAQHNVLERKRRNDLKGQFQILRLCVPEIVDKERAPKVVILTKSEHYITKLQREHGQLRAQREHHQRKREQLQRRLAELAKSHKAELLKHSL